MRTLTGAPYETIYHARDTYSQENAYDEDQLFNLFTQKFKEGAILQTYMGYYDYYLKHKYYGLYSGVYNVLGVF